MRVVRFRLECLVAVLALVFAACTSTTDPTTTTVGGPSTTTLSTATTTVDPLLGQALPFDPDIRRGQLDNGLSYYVAANDSPGGRAELRLLVDAGSLQEDPDQAGMAHFLEHMMFNGTERFPRNELVDVLESFGPRFGPDINAHTNFDETVYELSLTTDDELIDLGMEVLREWASRATLTETDVVEERGIVLDEWRLRAQGFGARVFDSLQRLIFEETPYEGHLPIGTDSSISGTTPQALSRYYDDWYQPQRMAVVAVGDFDIDEMEQRIVETFSDFESDRDQRDWAAPQYEPSNEPRFGTLVDAEAAAASVSVVWPVVTGETISVLDYQRQTALSLALQILTDRLNEDARETDSPLLTAATANLAWARIVGLRGVDAGVRADKAQDGMEKVLAEVERMKRFGVTTAEFERALAGYETRVNQVHSQQESRQDAQLAGLIAAHHLAGGDLMSPDQRFMVESGIAGRLTKDDLNSALFEVLEGAPVVFTVGPDDPGVVIPDEAAIRAAVAAMPGLTLQRRQTPDSDVSELMDKPEPATIVSSVVDPRFEYTTLTFENGATVYLWESDIATEGVFGLIEGFGGTSVIDTADIPEANLMVDIATRSGVGEFDLPALQRFLSDKLAFVQPYVSETRQGLEASAAIPNTETMFQLIHLYMTRPRFDESVVAAVLSENKTLLASRDDLPDLLFSEKLNQGYYGDDPRYEILPSEEQLADFDATVARQLFVDRYANAADFAFAFVGDFETEVMIDLAASYIGTLPGTGEPGGFVDNQPLPPREVQLSVVEAGIGQQGKLGMFFTNEFESVLKDRVVARLTTLIVDARLRDRIREELGTTYAISSTIDLQRDPDPFVEASITSTGDPAGLDVISQAILADLADLRNSGPNEAEFGTGIEQLRDEFDLIDNRTLAIGLVTAHLYPDQPVIELADRYALIDQLTAADVRAMAGIAFGPGQRIEVRQVPAS